jgi:hypothetical protein
MTGPFLAGFPARVEQWFAPRTAHLFRRAPYALTLRRGAPQPCDNQLSTQVAISSYYLIPNNIIILQPRFRERRHCEA